MTLAHQASVAVQLPADFGVQFNALLLLAVVQFVAHILTAHAVKCFHHVTPNQLLHSPNHCLFAAATEQPISLDLQGIMLVHCLPMHPAFVL